MTRKLKELLLSNTDDTALIREEILSTIWDGANERAVFRYILPITDGGGMYQCQYVYQGKPNLYADKVGEGAQSESNSYDYNSVDIPIYKYSTKVDISNEMIEDAKFKLVEMELQKAGERIENSLNQLCLSAILDGCTNSDVSPTTTMTVEDLVSGYKTLSNLYYNPTDLILNPTGFEDLVTDDSIGNFNPGEDRLFGMDVNVLNLDTTDDATSSWDGTDASNHFMGLLIDRANCGIIALRQDITLSEINNVQHDLTSLVVDARIGFAVTNTDASVRILTV